MPDEVLREIVAWIWCDYLGAYEDINHVFDTDSEERLDIYTLCKRLWRFGEPYIYREMRFGNEHHLERFTSFVLPRPHLWTEEYELLHTITSCGTTSRTTTHSRLQ